MSRNENDPTGTLSLPRSKTLSDWIRNHLSNLLLPLAHWLDRIGISPNALTICGVLLSLCAGITLALGYRTAGAILIAVSGLMDGLDGLVARSAQKTTRFGAFLDSVLDRWSDGFLFIGVLAWYARGDTPAYAILSSVALISSLLVSYTRARAEGIGARCTRGLFTRLERLVTLVAGLVLDQMNIALWIIAVLSTFTALQRIYLTYKYVKTYLDREHQ
jgi:CDP-diacylglycerol--glycerol-3-phosphate 3-phosphatidyltransferase